MDRLRLVSLIIAAVYVAVFATMFIRDAMGPDPCPEDLFEGILCAVGWLVASLMCIWRGDELGESMTGVWVDFFRPITKSSPGPAVAFMGWVLLIAPGIIMLLVWGGILNRLV
ncbi:MAG: hypothetical protein JSW47_12980 [Phycisphaerales bacterium]|nr:MAG: hypothetical protein JSW47_12980 [Phycisphaerales bacterium]